MSGFHIVGIYVLGALATTALFRVRPPKWFLTLVLGTERDLYIARPNADELLVTNVVAAVARRGTVVMGVLWPLLAAVFVLDAPGIAWRRYRDRRSAARTEGNR